MSASAEIAATDLTADEAKVLIARVLVGLDDVRDSIIRLNAGRAWLALGYLSWEGMCDAEFKMRLQIPAQQRRELTRDLRAEGMSTRQIGQAIGVSKSQVAVDLQVSSSGQVAEPPPVTGLDGKRYTLPTMAQVRAERTAPRAPRTDVVVTISTVLLKAADAAEAAGSIKAEHLHHRTEEATRWARRLRDSVEALQRLLVILEGASE